MLIPPNPEKAMGHVEIEFSDADLEWANSVATARTENAAKKGWTPILRLDTARADRIGARGELAVVRAYGAEWTDPERPAVEDLHHPDVAGIDVRTVSRAGMPMPIRPRDADPRAYTLVCVPSERCAIIVGWKFGWECKKDDFWREADDKGPGYWAVPWSVLHDPAWLPIRRRR
jgi:hypothetical protein